jgi:SPP1 family predicted phage head-tail adaptor
MTLAAGRLRHWVSLQRFGFVMDSAGDPVQDPDTGELRREWTELAACWAAIEPSSAREFNASQVGQSEVTGKIVIRYRPDILPTDRIVHNGKVYNPAGILADKESGLEYITVPVSEGVGVGE